MAPHRAYEYDAFVSHNAFDGATRLVEDLKARGVRSYCDEATDLSDRRVRDRISQALAKSRLVLVHAPEGFRDSPWCRAEYGFALAQGRQATIVRVAVASSPGSHNVPATLRDAPVFELPESVDRLAMFLIDANDLGHEVGVEVDRQASDAQDRQLDDADDPSFIGTWPLELVSAARWQFERQRKIDADLLQDLTELAEAAMPRRDADVRTNGLHALILAAAAHPDVSSLHRLEDCLRREASTAVLKEALWLYFHVGLPACGSAPWLAAALVRSCAYGPLENCREYISGFPSAVRCRVLLGTLELGTIDLLERLVLLEQRIGRLLDPSSDESGLEPFEIQESLREFLPYLFDGDGVPCDAPLPKGYEQIVVGVLRWSERHAGMPVRAMGPHACDVLVEPLARMMIHPESSLAVFEWACQVVEENTSARELISRLRTMGHLVRSGFSWIEAQKQTDDAFNGAKRYRKPFRLD